MKTIIKRRVSQMAAKDMTVHFNNNNNKENKMKAYGIVDLANRKLWCRDCDSDREDGRYYIFKSFDEAMTYLEKNELTFPNSGVSEVTIDVEEAFS